MKDENQTTLTVATEIAYLDALQIVVADMLVDVSRHREAGALEWMLVTPLTQSQVRDCVRSQVLEFGKACGAQAQMTQLRMMEQLGLAPSDYQLVRNAAIRSIERAFKWEGGPVRERFSASLRIQVTLGRDELVRLIVARVMGWMLQRRDRERDSNWWRVNWWRGLTKRMVRWYIRRDLVEYGLDAVTKADRQIKLCSDALKQPGTADLPNHVHQMAKWRVERTFGLGAYAL